MGVLTVTTKKRCLIEERREFVFGHCPQMITTRVVRMRYPRSMQYLGDNLQSNYNARTSNTREEIRYKNVDSVHIGVKLLYDHEGTSDWDVTK